MESTLTIDSNGTKIWRLNGEYHRENGPAIEWYNGTKVWYLNGKQHREDGPAVEYPDDSKVWYLNGKRHRENGPAIEHLNGTKFWYLNGKQLTKRQLLSKKIRKNYPNLYNNYVVYCIMGS